MRGLGVYRELLRNRKVVRLLAGEFINYVGNWLYVVAIFVVIYEESRDPVLIGVFGAVRLLPMVILSVPAGHLADRFERRRILVVTVLLLAILQVVLAVLAEREAPTIALAAVAILATCVSAFFPPAMGAYFPNVVSEERLLGPANSLYSTLKNVAYIAGPALAGVVLAIGSVTLAFLVNAVTFLVIGAVLSTLPPSYAGRGEGAEPEESAPDGGTARGPDAPADAALAAASAPLEPTRPTLSRRRFAGLLLLPAASSLFGSGTQVITVVLAIDVLKGGPEANGYLNAAIGIGGVLGGVLAGALIVRRRTGRLMAAGLIATMLAATGLGATESLVVALVLIGLSETTSLLVDIFAETLFQRLVPDEIRGRAGGWLETISWSVGMAGAFAVPIVLDLAGPLVALGGLGLAYMSMGLVALALVGSVVDRVPTRYEALIERLAGLPIFTGVSRSWLDASSSRFFEVPVSAGQAVVTEGEPADRLYVIAEGTFQVTQDHEGGTRRIRTLGPDEVIGELGLLHRAPRSVTVTAETDGLLLALEAEDFLELVSSHLPLLGHLHSLHVPPAAAEA